MKNQILVITILLLTPLFSFSQGNCDQADLAYIGANLEAVQAIATGCGTDCLFAADPEQCVRDCMQSQTPLTDLCITCFVQQVDCVVDNCFFACAFSPGSAGCTDCVESNCVLPFQECAGIYDADGDTFTTLSDCDDNNPTINPGATEIWYDGIDQNCDGADDYDQDGDGDRSVDYGGSDCDDLNPDTFNDAYLIYADNDNDGYGEDGTGVLACMLAAGYSLEFGDCNDENNTVYPGAPGTGQNIDNDCNNVIEDDEVINLCFGDFNGDLVVNSADLIALLSGFGCVEDCIYDITGDDVENTADLILFLTIFGNSCVPE